MAGAPTRAVDLEGTGDKDDYQEEGKPVAQHEPGAALALHLDEDSGEDLDEAVHRNLQANRKERLLAQQREQKGDNYNPELPYKASKSVYKRQYEQGSRQEKEPHRRRQSLAVALCVSGRHPLSSRSARGSTLRGGGMGRGRGCHLGRSYLRAGRFIVELCRERDAQQGEQAPEQQAADACESIALM